MSSQTDELKSHLDELKDSEGRRTVVAEHEADDAEELSVEAAVAQTEQEAAQQRHPETEPQHHTNHEVKPTLGDHTFNQRLQPRNFIVL